LTGARTATPPAWPLIAVSLFAVEDSDNLKFIFARLAKADSIIAGSKTKLNGIITGELLDVASAVAA